MSMIAPAQQPTAAAAAASASSSPAAAAAPASSLLNPGLPTYANPAAMLAQMLALTSRHDLVRNFVGVISDMSSKALVVETALFPADALDFYSRYNLFQLDLEGSARDRALHAQFYTPARGGGQGDYRDGMPEKIANVVDALRKFPSTKRAVLPIPHTRAGSATADHTDTDEAKCLRELHFHLDIDPTNPDAPRRLCCTGLMRAQAASIFPKNIHFIGTIMHSIAKQIDAPVGTYTHIVTTLVNER